VTADHTISASFALLGPYTITATAGAGGTIAPAGAVSVACGGDQGFTIAPNADFVIADVVVDGGSVGPVASYTFTNVQADHTISASFADVQAPSITVVFPNGGENLIVGSGVKYTWIATDNVPIPTVDLYVSRDYGATYVLEAAAVPNTGSFATTVSPPGTNVDITPVYSAYLKVVASDGVFTVSDSSDAPYSIYDLVVETVVAKFDVVPADPGLEIRWRLTTPDLFESVRLERGDLREGPWAAVEGERRQVGDAVVAADPSAEAGRAYWYRLIAVTHGGSAVTFGPVKGEAAFAGAFELTSVTPNPAHGPVRVDFSVAREGLVDLSVWDLQGRRVTSLVSGVQSAGRYHAVWDGVAGGQRVPAGIYFVRYQGGGLQFTKRIVIAR
jgi:hypothetical protein